MVSALSYQPPVIWNQLPVSVRHSTSVSSFKSAYPAYSVDLYSCGDEACTAATTPDLYPCGDEAYTAATTPDLYPCGDQTYTAATTPDLYPCGDQTYTAATTPDLYPCDDQTYTAATTPDLYPCGDQTYTAATTLAGHNFCPFLPVTLKYVAPSLEDCQTVQTSAQLWIYI